MPTPSILFVLEIASYLLILMLVGLFQMLLFVVTAFGFIAVAVLSITGYLMIPLLLTKNFSKYFWNWLDQERLPDRRQELVEAYTETGEDRGVESQHQASRCELH